MLENKIWKLDLSAHVEQRIRENKGVLGFKQHDMDVTSVYDFGAGKTIDRILSAGLRFPLQDSQGR